MSLKDLDSWLYRHYGKYTNGALFAVIALAVVADHTPPHSPLYVAAGIAAVVVTLASTVGVIRVRSLPAR
jgi:hypothetical protein